ncbi:protein tyrosine phosphatase [Coccidioides immitis RS]|uniref:Very-long-chain (3R)-3-hydroxyacyl-CoA dehydratase n=3 Tax=Coccidioides TaxID=5500 RepID=J3K1J8_COCIM|nr:protein tyrosine phosphatase [Coccidioides immitis RS]EAS27864.3 protein tyrosine phosphatase [Coccidioides immitis RS]KMU87473.1 tyrosine phosphatase [Coccidioides immitis H538.4]TPX20557.1 hypothetical protein DIZ76_016449 [Coccidioides immitis]
MSAKAPASSVPAKTVFTTSRAYLLLYNTASFALWSVITLRLFLLLALLVPTGHVAATYNALFPLLRVTQSLALLEIVHSLVGIVRAPVITTLMQVASRIVVVWGVMWMFAEERVGREMGILGGGRGGGGKLGDWGFVGCLGAWGVTECVRYGFFMLQISGNGVPGWLSWLRYNTFFVLYPIGISSECVLMYLALEPAIMVHPLLPWVFKAILLVYVPGSYILYTHMMAQRRKVMKAAAKKAT